MDVYEAIRSRYSVRAYQNRPIEPEKLDRIIEAVRLAPSGSNRQPWKFIIVRDDDLRKRLVPAARDQAFLADAPVVVAGVGLMPRRVMACDIPGDPVDVAIALEHLALAAVAEGLGTCWIGAFNQEKVCDILGIPAGEAKVVELMCLGYPADEPRAKNRKPVDEIVCYDRFA
jgi:nitroreductase